MDSNIVTQIWRYRNLIKIAYSTFQRQR